MARYILRWSLNLLHWTAAALILALLAPVLLGIALHRLYRRAELEAFYDGDEARRDKDRWRNG